MATKRDRGDGSIRLRRGRFWIRFRVDGRRYERATDATSREGAAAQLRDVLAKLRRPPSEATVADLLPLMVADYEHKGQSLDQIKKRWKHLGPAFGERRAESITTTDMDAYVAARRRRGAAASTVQNEIACLRRIFRLAAQHTPPIIAQVPKFPTLRVRNAATNFIEESQFRALLAELPEHLRPVAAFGYWTGWRRGEVLGLRRDQVDLVRGTATLDASQTKTRRARTIFLPDELRDILVDHEERTVEFERSRRRVVRTMFHRDGKPIVDFYAAWRAAAKRAGVPGAKFHDFRRTAARAYVRAGVPERVAMDVLGHQTRSIFDRYNIVTESDLREAARLVGSAPTAPPMGAKRGKIRAVRPSRSKRKLNKPGT